MLNPPPNAQIYRGAAAIELAESSGCSIFKHADPLDEARPVSIDEARELLRVDPSLLYAFPLVES